MARTIAALIIAATLGLAPEALAGAQEEMIATDKAFAAMSISKGAHAAFLAYIADDVRLFEGDHPPIIGRKAVEEYYAKNPQSPGEKLDWKPLEAEASPDGVLGFTRGTWIYTAKAKNGKTSRLTGYYVTEWKRQPDGKYKFILDIGGTDKAAKAD
jgi:ketosteroid isomerase-like protein